MPSAPLLNVQALSVTVPGPGDPTVVVDRVDYAVQSGEIFGIAGESGSGKTLSVLALLGLAPPGATIRGTATFNGRDLIKLPPAQLRQIRGRDIAMVFQDPMRALHPMMRVGRQLTEHARQHLGLSRAESRARAIELLQEVRIPDPSNALRAYPHQFSGGMRQRIAIAMALICGPKLLIADEPTTALDVSVQAGILRTLARLRETFHLSVILITHDLRVMSAIADRVTIFYAGRVIESGSTLEMLKRPRHPYTAGLLASLPRLEGRERTPLRSIGGSTPSPMRRPDGCAFHPRCSYAQASCAVHVPVLVRVAESPSRMLACPIDPLR